MFQAMKLLHLSFRYVRLMPFELRSKWSLYMRDGFEQYVFMPLLLLINSFRFCPEIVPLQTRWEFIAFLSTCQSTTVLAS